MCHYLRQRRTRTDGLCCRHPHRVARLKLILDTNIVLDWLVFHDTSMAGLQPALDQGLIEIVTHEPAIVELRRVLTYPQFKLAIDQQQELLARYNAQTRVVTVPAELPANFPRCRDHDDQHFLDLAYHERADGLVSKDDAILELTKRVQKFGVTVLDPEQLAAKLKDLAVMLMNSGASRRTPSPPSR